MSSSPLTIHLMPQEELSSLVARLEDASTDQITIIIPELSIVGQSLITLQLLAEQAHHLKKNLVISSESKQVEKLAERAGLRLSTSMSGLPEHGFMAGTDVAVTGAVAAAAAMPQSAKMEQEGAPSEPMAANPPPVPAAAPPPAQSFGAQQPKGPLAKIGLTGKMKWIALGVVGLLLLVGLVFVFDYFVPQATVTVNAQKQTMDRDVRLTVDPTATQVNVSALVVPGTEVSATASKSQSFKATGSKEVGTKASGQVTVSNYDTDDSIILPANTVVASAGKQFRLAQTISVPAASSSINPDTSVLETKPGTASASITAAVIGEEYNLAANTTFSVANYESDEVTARNSAAIAGGTKETLKVVTAQDQAQAVESLTGGLTEEAKTTLKTKVPEGRELLEGTVQVEVLKSEFSHKVGDEAEDFTLNLEVEATGLAVDPNDIKEVLNEEIASKVPEGYKLDSDDSNIENDVVEVEEDGSAMISSSYVGQVVPDIDEEAMRKAIAGKKPSVVGDYLKSQPNLQGYDISITPSLPGPFNHMPRIDSRITIKVEVK